MKTRASGAIVSQGIATPEECWRYVISLPISAVVSGMESLDLLRDNLRMARTLKPMDAAEKSAILERTRDIALGGKVERFKTTRAFDGPVGRKLYGIQG
jgi:predicted aldo/keto reductase-like oxidoreductase